MGSIGVIPRCGLMESDMKQAKSTAEESSAQEKFHEGLKPALDEAEGF
jgi:hypothetical protein